MMAAAGEEWCYDVMQYFMIVIQSANLYPNMHWDCHLEVVLGIFGDHAPA
jgi:hypothetical protein